MNDRISDRRYWITDIADTRYRTVAMSHSVTPIAYCMGIGTNAYTY
jgi:hypothetical protein